MEKKDRTKFQIKRKLRHSGLIFGAKRQNIMHQLNGLIRLNRR